MCHNLVDTITVVRKTNKSKSKKNAVGSHKLCHNLGFPQTLASTTTLAENLLPGLTWKLKTSRNSPNNQLHKCLFVFSKTIVSTFATLPALNSHDFCKEKERKVKIDVQDVQDVQDARVTVKRKALTASARSTITTCNLKVICSQIEPFTFTTTSVFSNMFEIDIISIPIVFANSNETFYKDNIGNRLQKNSAILYRSREPEVDSVFCLKLE